MHSSKGPDQSLNLCGQGGLQEVVAGVVGPFSDDTALGICEGMHQGETELLLQCSPQGTVEFGPLIGQDVCKDTEVGNNLAEQGLGHRGSTRRAETFTSMT